MFGYTVSMGRVHDRIRVREGNDSIILTVDSDPMKMVAGMSQVQENMKKISEESTDEQLKEAALHFATVIFKDAQAHQLMDFYDGDAGCVINVCGTYFAQRLSKKISKAQKKRR